LIQGFPTEDALVLPGSKEMKKFWETASSTINHIKQMKIDKYGKHKYPTWCAPVNNRKKVGSEFITWHKFESPVGKILSALTTAARHLGFWEGLAEFEIDNISFMAAPPHHESEIGKRHCDNKIIGDAFVFLNGSDKEYNLKFYVEQEDETPVHTVVVPAWGGYLCKDLARWGYYHIPSHAFNKDGVRIGLIRRHQ
jgi:hypothetical protein